MSNFNMSILDEKKLTLLDKYMDGFDDKEHNIITILHYAQDIFDYLPKELQLYIARKIGIPASKVNGIVSFYSFFNENPTGKYVANVCMGTACFVKHSQDILDEFNKILKLDENGMSADKLFSINSIRCLGACGIGPVVKINDKIFGHVKKEDVAGIIKSYRDKEGLWESKI